jgi:hypothetical protein
VGRPLWRKVGSVAFSWAYFIDSVFETHRIWSRSRSYFTTDSQSVSQSVCLGIEHPCGTCDQILFPVEMLLYEICGLVSIGRPLWREDGSAVCRAITQWSESLRTRNHTLLSHLRLPQPGGPSCSCSCFPQEHWVCLINLHIIAAWIALHLKPGKAVGTDGLRDLIIQDMALLVLEFMPECLIDLCR